MYDTGSGDGGGSTEAQATGTGSTEAQATGTGSTGAQATGTGSTGASETGTDGATATGTTGDGSATTAGPRPLDPLRERVATCTSLGQDASDGGYWQYDLKIPDKCHRKFT